MRKFLVSLTFRYIESNRETYCILDEEKYNEYKQFFCVDCKPLIESGESFDEEGEYEGTPGITIEEIARSLENAVEVTPEIEKALNLLRFILPSQTDALENIKQEILDNKYLEE
jgi:hypothetical protein